MAIVHVYFAIEDLALNAAQRQTLITALRALGPQSDPSPARLNHWRTRGDGRAAIFEAAFNEASLTVAAFKARLAGLFGVDVTTIAHAVNTVRLGGHDTAVLTLSRGGTDYLRMAFFAYDGGMTWPTWAQSRESALAYLAANAADWDGE